MAEIVKFPERREPLLFDALKVSLADPERRLKGDWNPGDPKQRALLKQLGDKVSRATRFSLTDEMTYFAEAVSLSSPPVVANLFSKARAPYDLMWIEWAVDPRERAMVESAFQLKRQPDREDHRAAFLIERDDRFKDYDGFYRVTPFSMTRDGVVLPWPVGLIYDLGDTDVPRLHIAMNDWDLRMNAAAREVSSQRVLYALSPTWLSKYAIKAQPNAQRGVTEYEFSPEDSQAVRYITSRSYYTAAGAAGVKLVDDFKDPGFRAKAAETVFREGSGDLRWVATILGLLNTYQQVVGEPQKPDYATPVERRIWGKVVPYMEFRKLSIKLPGKTIAKALARVQKDYHPKRRHQVRGFYRTYRKLNKRVWVKPHERGDARIGYVHKEYVLEPAADFKPPAPQAQ